ncbi:MAG TPA: XRE family transcriptional regulator [Nevskiales bacterium]|nr:XRE family transcriptional regulator [Nevskiales bacterium]
MTPEDALDKPSHRTPAPAEAGSPYTLEQHIGRFLHRQRLAQGLTIAEVAGLAGISRGMLSKIENGQVSTSLETLHRLTSVLGVTLSQLFKNFDVPEGGAQHVKSGQGLEVVRRGTKRGHTYHLLAYDMGPRKSMEPFLVTIDDAGEVFPDFVHAGIEFIYVLEGRLEYRHGRHTYLLEPGDSLTFPGEIPHGPERLIEVPIRLLAVMNYGPENS